MIFASAVVAAEMIISISNSSEDSVISSCGENGIYIVEARWN